MLKIGKLESDILKELVFDKLTYKRSEVKTGPGLGEDCAVIDFGDYDCFLSTDPITAAVGEVGRLAVHISCNDVASNGVEPIGLLVTLILPVGTDADDVGEIMEQIDKSGREIGVAIIGGHTEISNAVNKPVIVSTAVGRKRRTEVEPRNVQPGDNILMTKHAGLEGIGIIASDVEGVERILSSAQLKEAKGFLEDISVVKEGVAAAEAGATQMHDVTEGGILGGVWEMCRKYSLGAQLVEEDIPMHSITKILSSSYDIDPLRLISSGSMIIIVPEETTDDVLKAVRALGIDISSIGKMCRTGKVSLLKRDGQTVAVDPPESDEIYKVIS